MLILINGRMDRRTHFRFDTVKVPEYRGTVITQHMGILSHTTPPRQERFCPPPQPPIQWVPGALSLGVKRLGRETDYSPASSTEVKEWVELYIHSRNTPSWLGAELKEAQGQLYFYLYLTRVYLKVSGPAAWSKNYKLYSSLPLGAVVSPFCESV
jgi:hypothetical protein